MSDASNDEEANGRWNRGILSVAVPGVYTFGALDLAVHVIRLAPLNLNLNRRMVDIEAFMKFRDDTA